MLLKGLSAFLPILVTAIGLGCLIIIIAIRRSSQRNQKRESPLSHDLIRPPGYSLQQKVFELDDDISSYMVGIITIPILMFSVHVSQSYYGNVPESTSRVVVSVLVGLILVGFVAYRLLKLMEDKKRKILGLEGEMFTGEELNQLMLHGCRVFHDIPIQYGNIDHVVVSQSGVFSINTKMRGKPKEGIGRAELVVDHQKEIMKFPDMEIPIPVSQLQTESKWLSKHLTSAVGQQIGVEPVLAFPGWYVKNGVRSGSVSVINPRNHSKFFVNSRQVFNPQEVQQIAHQLEQMCRNVEPSYKEKKEWGST